MPSLSHSLTFMCKCTHIMHPLVYIDILHSVCVPGCIPGSPLLECADWTMAVPWSQLLCLVGDHAKHWTR